MLLVFRMVIYTRSQHTHAPLKQTIRYHDRDREWMNTYDSICNKGSINKDGWDLTYTTHLRDPLFWGRKAALIL